MARQAFEMRNRTRTQARLSMKDTVWAQYLFENETNRTFDQLVEKHQGDGISGNELWNKIIRSSMRSRDSINAVFGLD